MSTKYVQQSLFDIKQERREGFLEKLIERLENERGLWQSNWDINNLNPINGANNKPFEGANRYKIASFGAEKNYNSQKWFTLKQIQELNEGKPEGRQAFLIKGSEAAKIDYSKDERKKEIMNELVKKYKKSKNTVQKKERWQDVILMPDDFMQINKQLEKALGNTKMFAFNDVSVFNADRYEGLEIKNEEKKPYKNISDVLKVFQKIQGDFEKNDFENETHELAYRMQNAYDAKDEFEKLQNAFTSLFVQAELGVNVSLYNELDLSLEEITNIETKFVKNSEDLSLLIGNAEKNAKEFLQYYERGYNNIKSEEKEKMLSEGFEIDYENRFEQIEKAQDYLKSQPEMSPEEFSNFLEMFDSLFDDVEVFFRANEKYLLANGLGPVKIDTSNFKLSEKDYQYIKENGMDKYIEKIRPVLECEFERDIKNNLKIMASQKFNEMYAFDGFRRNEKVRTYVTNRIKDFLVENEKCGLDFKEGIVKNYKKYSNERENNSLSRMS